jgi:hypothetical protein
VAELASEPVETEPLRPRLPDQAPDAVHEVALLLDQLRVLLAPLVTEVGFALSVNVGEDAVLTVIVTLRVAVPPAPVQLSEYVDELVSGPVDVEPLTLLVPDQAPEALQLEAFVALQFKVAALPLLTDVGLAVSVITGVGVGVLPPSVTVTERLMR